MLLPSSLVAQLVATMKAQHEALAGVLERQTAVEAARVQLERDRFEHERAKDAKAEAAREQWAAQQEGTDLHETIMHTITEMSGRDAALKAQLLGYARLRKGRDIGPDQIAAEIRRGISPAVL
jgi:hypothetical protein